MKKFYAGIGSRETPENIINFMTQIAFCLSSEGYVLRSGGADGADIAFEKGASFKEIFLPWKGFNNSKSPFVPITKEAEDIARKFHPIYDQLKQGAQKLHSRNVYQVLGKDLKSPVEFIICWTKDGKSSGGTGQALRIAQAYNIKIYNLFKKEDQLFWEEKIKEYEEFIKWNEP